MADRHWGDGMVSHNPQRHRGSVKSKRSISPPPLSTQHRASLSASPPLPYGAPARQDTHTGAAPKAGREGRRAGVGRGQGQDSAVSCDVVCAGLLLEQSTAKPTGAAQDQDSEKATHALHRNNSNTHTHTHTLLFQITRRR